MGYFFAIASAVCTVIGSFFAKFWVERGEAWYFLALTLLFYIASSIFFPFALRYGTLTLFNALASVIIFGATAAIGLLVFRESITIAQSFGLIFAFVAVILLSLK